MEKTSKKLAITKETVRILSNDELSQVSGGAATTAVNCTQSQITTASNCSQSQVTTAISCKRHQLSTGLICPA